MSNQPNKMTESPKERPLAIRLAWLALFWVGGIVGLTLFVYLMKMIMNFVGLSTPS